MSIGSNIHESRESQSLTEHQVAKASCISLADYRSIEMGALEPSASQLAGIAAFLCDSMDRLCGLVWTNGYAYPPNPMDDHLTALTAAALRLSAPARAALIKALSSADETQAAP